MGSPVSAVKLTPNLDDLEEEALASAPCTSKV